MVVDDFDFVRVTILESEADAPLVIDTDAPSARQIPTKRFKAIGRRDAEVLQARRRVQLYEPHPGPRENFRRKAPGAPHHEKPMRLGRCEGSDHLAR